MEPVRVAIVGAGLMGRWHADACERSGAAVVAVLDPDHGAASALAVRHGGRVAATLDELGGAVDAVHVCTPLATHAVIVEDALRNGLHVLVEKPLAADGDETARLLALAADRERLLVPVHQLPFQPGVRRVLEARAQGRLGSLVRVSFHACSAGGEGRDPAARRAVLREILPHPASLLHRLLGDALDAAALALVCSTDDDLELAGTAGEVAVSVALSLRGRPTRNVLEVVGERGSATADLFHGFAVLERGRVSRADKLLRPFRVGAGTLGGAGANLARRTLTREPAYPGLRELARAFHAAVAAGGPPPVPSAETRAAAALLDRVATRG